ncbi:MAG: InlB B-repeat-containing protein [Oscillospiraceae bacterium]|nr:InlB B-repeat-containing protein [Oscillospiraceae bacterium]
MRNIIGKNGGAGSLSRLLALVLCLMLALGAMSLLPAGNVLAVSGDPCVWCIEFNDCSACGTPDCVRHVLGDCENADCVGVIRLTIPTPIVGAAQSAFNVTIVGDFGPDFSVVVGAGTRWDPVRDNFQDENYTKIVYLRIDDGGFFPDEPEPIMVLVNGAETEFERYNPTDIIRASIPFDTLEEGATTFTVTFDANYGNFSGFPTYDLFNVPAGTRIDPPQNPTGAGGYYFHGWYTTQNAAEGTAASFPIGITRDTTFFARWETFDTAIERIDITPTNITISPGQEHRFEAEVFGGENPHQGIRWTVSGTTCPETVIFSGNSGILVAGPNETGTVTVEATSLIDENISGEALVEVEDPEENLVQPPVQVPGAEYGWYPGAVPGVAPVAHEVPQTGITGRMILPIVLGTLGVALIAGTEILRRYKKKHKNNSL